MCGKNWSPDVEWTAKEAQEERGRKRSEKGEEREWKEEGGIYTFWRWSGKPFLGKCVLEMLGNSIEIACSRLSSTWGSISLSLSLSLTLFFRA